jgi:DNA-directed RNA polymerase beta' subunit
VLAKSANIKRCGQECEDGCGAPQPDKFTREGIARIVAHYHELKQQQPLEVEYVHRLFRRITDEDVDFMGLSRFWCRPDWMICTMLRIPPPQVRPSVVQDNNQRSEDDLTHKLFDIIKNDKTLQQKIENNSSKNVIDEMTNVVQYHVATLVDNEIPGVAPSAQRSGRPLKSIQSRLGGKEGRIRYNIQGKRVEFSARSVITPDPNLSVAEIGVPLEIAMNLTSPERVTQYNRDKLYKLVQNGADKWPGAKTIVRKDGRMISLKHVNTSEIVLYNGDVVNRHLLDNDILLFNRQPTLHKMSMMGHRVKVLPYKTFRMNVLTTRPYNADFDGDEMNAHIPQSYEATVELEEIAAVPHHIITPRHAKPMIGVYQDTLVGTYRLTQPGIEFTRREFMNLMMWNKRFDGMMPGGRGSHAQRWTGQQVLSALLPPVNIEMGNKSFDGEKDSKESHNYVKIVQGDIQQGVVDGDIYMKPSKGIIHVAYNDHGSKDTVGLLDALQNTIENFLVLNGFSVGISDLIADEETKKEIDRKIQEKKKQVEQVILQVHLDLFDNNTGKTNQQEFEDQIFGILNQATSDAGSTGQQSLSSENRLLAMVRSGSKGEPLNVAQMMACLGQTAIEGKRVPYGFTDRTLPHYKKYDDSSEARGFIESSFIRGLTPQQFFFHAMSGREGLIDTAVKTADTGYIQRQLIKSMEDLTVQHDGTVRDANNNIIQFHYGEDGINPTKIETQGLPIGKLSHEQIRTEFGMEGIDWSTVLEEGVVREDGEKTVEEYVNDLLHDQRMMVEGVFQKKSLDSGSVFAPVNLARWVLNIKNRFGLKATDLTNLTPEVVLAGIKKIIERTQSYHKIWAALLRFHLAPHKLIVKERFTKDAFEMLMELIVLQHMKAWVQPGDQVGIVAAQSIGEPATQMTLNSVDWDTKIVIAKDGIIQTPAIGEWIDEYYHHCLENKKECIQYLPNDQIYIPLNDGHDWKAVSCDEDGNMKWTTLEAITRHPVVNEDGSNTILKVTLESGRKVKATKGKSFLTLQNGKIKETNGSDLKLGDSLPIANHLSMDQLGYITEMNVRTILPPSEYLYGTEVQSALQIMQSSGERHWFQKNQGVLFTVPYGRSDSFREAFEKGHNSNDIRPGMVYNKHMKKGVSQIPETFQLTESLGFFCGAYLAEGMSNHTQVMITNNDASYLMRVSQLMEEWKVGTHTVTSEKIIHNTDIKGLSTSLIIHSTILAKVMKTWFGRVCYDKTIPNWVLQAPEGFLKGLMDAYISGDGTVDKRQGTVHATSVSYDLLEGIQHILARFGIYSKMTSRMPVRGKFQSVARNYTLTLPAKYSNRFAKTFSLSILEKQKRLNDHHGHQETDQVTSKWKTTNHVVWDKIKTIEEVTPMGEGWVYDVTVEETKNFMTTQLILVRDTFHQAGVASKSAVTRGVPRLRELLKVTQNPKATSLTIYLKPEYRDNKDKAREVVQDLELTVLRNITDKVAIYWDENDEETIVEEDRALIAFYRQFEAGLMGAEDEKEKSKWMLRLELNREEMFNRNISIQEVVSVINAQFNNEINIVYSDYNSDKLVMRIRLPNSDKKDKDTASQLDDFANLKKFQNKLLNSIVIRGLPGIKAVTFRNDKQYVEPVGDKYEPVNQFVLDTDGSNFIKVMNHPAVDGTKVYSTNVWDVYEVLGIEATRAILFNEISSLFESVGVNYRHLCLLCDVMTRFGRLMSIDRYGINKNDIGTLAKASFEETEKILLKAALFGEVDPVTGVSANIMMGQAIRGGTAFSQILLDDQMLVKLMESIKMENMMDEEEEGDLSRLDESGMKKMDPCSSTQFQMNMIMPDASALMEEDDVEFNVI